MKMIAHITLLFTLASLGLAADRERQSESDDVRESVFRWQFAHHSAPGELTNAQVYFLEVETKGGDPSDAFMKRFADHKPPVRKRSSCAKRGVTDEETGERGIIFGIKRIDWKSDTEVEVTAWYYEGGWGSDGYTYKVIRQNGKWSVTSEEQAWIG